MLTLHSHGRPDISLLLVMCYSKTTFLFLCSITKQSFVSSLYPLFLTLSSFYIFCFFFILFRIQYLPCIYRIFYLFFLTVFLSFYSSNCTFPLPETDAFFGFFFHYFYYLIFLPFFINFFLYFTSFSYHLSSFISTSGFSFDFII